MTCLLSASKIIKAASPLRMLGFESVFSTTNLMQRGEAAALSPDHHS